MDLIRQLWRAMQGGVRLCGVQVSSDQAEQGVRLHPARLAVHHNSPLFGIDANCLEQDRLV